MQIAMTEYHIRLILYAKLVNLPPELILRSYDDRYREWIKSERIIWCNNTGQRRNNRWTVEQNNSFDGWLCARWNFKSIGRKSIKRIPIK